MKVALTGGSGFVGGCILNLLLNSGYQVKALKNRTPISISHENLEVIQGSLDDTECLQNLVEGTDIVIHCGGIVAAKKAKTFYDINQHATETLIERAQNSTSKRFLLISSIAARKANLSHYAKSKRSGEEALEQSSIENWDIFRLSAVYGPGDMQILGLFKILKSGIGIVPKSKHNRLSLIFVEDVARAVLEWINKDTSNKEIYEISDDQMSGYSWQEIYQQAGHLLGVNIKTITLPKSLLYTYAFIKQSLAKIKGKSEIMTFGKVREMCHPNWSTDQNNFATKSTWSPNVNLEGGLKVTFDWYKHRNLL